MWLVNWFLFIMGALLNITGLAGLAESFAVWSGFLGRFMEVYTSWVRAPIANFLHKILFFLPIVPHLVVDFILIWGGFFIAVNFSSLKREGKSLFGTMFSERSLWRMLVLFPAYYLVTPFVVLRGLFSEDPTVKAIALDVFYAYLTYIAAILMIAFIGYQFELVKLKGA
jgi:hypothetical protein